MAVHRPDEISDIGSPASSTLTLDDEYHIGLQVVRQLREEGQIIEDPEATEYLQALGSRIVEKYAEQSRAQPAPARRTRHRNVLDFPFAGNLFCDQEALHAYRLLNDQRHAPRRIVAKHALILVARPLRRRGRVTPQTHHGSNVGGSGGADMHELRSNEYQSTPSGRTKRRLLFSASLQPRQSKGSISAV